MFDTMNATLIGRYDVIRKTPDFPLDFWAVKVSGDRVLIESTEEDSYWVRLSALESAIRLGHVICAE